MPGQADFLSSIYQTAFVSGGDTARMMRGLLKLACERFEMSLGMLLRIENDRFTVLASYDSEGDRIPVGMQSALAGTPCEQVFKRGEIVVVENLEDCSAMYPGACVDFKQYIGVPVRIDNQVIGTLCFINSQVSSACRVREEEVGVLSLVVASLIERNLHLESEHQLHRVVSILESSDDAIFTLSLDGKILNWNVAAQTLFGYRCEEAKGMSFKDLFRERDHNLLSLLLERIRQDRGADSFETVNIRKNGSHVQTSFTLSPIHDQDGRIHSAAAVVRGIDEKKRAERALALSEQRYALAAKGSNDGLWDWDLQTGEVYYSPRLKAILGYTDDQLEPTFDTWRDRIHPDDLAQFDESLSSHLADDQANFYHEHRIITRDGEERWVLTRGMAVRDETGRAVRIAGLLTDITRQKQSEAALIKQAQKDKLTGLPNREMLTEIIRCALARSGRHPDYKFAVLFLDFDRFKVINDSLGHEFGDMLLVNIAQQLRVQLRTVDVAARLGGDEFVILLDGIDGLGGAIQVAERLLRYFSKPHSVGGHDVTSTASIGIVTNDGDYTKPEQMIRDADTAMYQAKAAGKAQYVVFDEQMHAKALQRLNLERELRRAIFLGQLSLVYQPIVSLSNGQLEGFEALVRWQHPELGRVPPDRFIEIAEETGEIIPIGNWVLRHACKQLASWKTQYPKADDIYMNINISKRQLTQPDTIRNLQAIFEQTGVSPSDVKLEITESVIMDDRDGITPVLNQIKDLGVQLAMDDFGTGHSSLSCLHRFPLDVLKIDREFIHNMEQRIEFTAVIQAIVTLAQTIGIRVVAEGLETSEQVAQLQALDCDSAQGYYFSKPLSSADAGDFITDQHGYRMSA